MYTWFECKVRYEKGSADGKARKVTEPYLVDAMSFTEAECRIKAEMRPFMSGDFQVSDIRRLRIAELIETDEEAADKWYMCRLAFITLDEKSGAEKQSAHSVIVKAAGLREAVRRLDGEMKGTLIDYTITSVSETKLMGVFHYQEPAPEGYVRAGDGGGRNP